MTTPLATSGPAPAPNNRHALLERVIAGGVGALLLGLQGINIGETSSNAELIKRVETALARQAEVIRGFDQEGRRIDKGLENQDKMIERLDRTLELLDKERTQH